MLQPRSLFKTKNFWSIILILALVPAAGFLSSIFDFRLVAFFFLAVALAIVLVVKTEQAYLLFPIISLFSFYDPANLGIAPEKIFLLVVTAVWATRKVFTQNVTNSNREVKFPRDIFLAYLLFLIINFFSALSNIDIADGMSVAVRTAIMRALTVYITFRLVSDIKTLKAAVFSLSILAFSMFSWMLYTIISTRDILFFRMIKLRMDATNSTFSASAFANPNIASLYNVIIFPILITAGIAARSKLAKVFYFGMSIICALIIGLTFSRSGLVDLAIIIIFLMLRLKLRRSVIATIAFVALTIYIIFSVTPYMSDRLSRAFAGNDGSTNVRFGIVNATWVSFQENPLLGSGPDTFRAQIKNYAYLIGDLTSQADGSIAAHNDLLEILVETGLLGLLSFLLLMGQFIRILVKINARISDQSLKIIFIGIQASLVGMLTDSVFHQVLIHSLAWFVFGLGLAALNIAGHEEEPAYKPVPVP